MNQCFNLTFCLFALRAETDILIKSECMWQRRELVITEQRYHTVNRDQRPTVCNLWWIFYRQYFLLLFSGGFDCVVYCYFVHLSCLIVMCPCVCVLPSDADELMNVLLYILRLFFFFIIVFWWVCAVKCLVFVFPRGNIKLPQLLWLPCFS